jgi:hypothetical protein
LQQDRRLTGICGKGAGSVLFCAVRATYRMACGGASSTAAASERLCATCRPDHAAAADQARTAVGWTATSMAPPLASLLARAIVEPSARAKSAEPPSPPLQCRAAARCVGPSDALSFPLAAAAAQCVHGRPQRSALGHCDGAARSAGAAGPSVCLMAPRRPRARPRRTLAQASPGGCARHARSSARSTRASAPSRA